MFGSIKHKYKLKLLRDKWRKKNPHNNTTIAKLCNLDNISVGIRSYGPLTVYQWGTKNERLKIGNFVSIADGVKFLLGGNHRGENFSTYPFNILICGDVPDKDLISKGSIVVEDDVWIGLDAMILSGVKIGKGAIIGAGSVVAKDIPPYAIAVGNPAKVVKYRFEDEIIQRQLDYDMSRLTDEYIRKNIDLFSTKLSNEGLNAIVNGGLIL